LEELDFRLVVLRRGAPYPLASPTVTIAFPRSTAFLADLPRPDLNRLNELGWDLPDTVHLAMPYFGAYPPAYEPTYSMLGLIIVPEKKAYFKSVSWNVNFLRVAHDISVEESVLHEKLHVMKDVEPRFRKGVPLSWEERLEITGEIKRESACYVIQKYGRRAEDVLERDADKRYREQAKGKTILGNVLGFWLRIYFLRNFERYKEFSIDMTPELMLPHVFESLAQNDADVKRIYRKEFNIIID